MAYVGSADRNSRETVERNMFLMSPLSFFCYFTSLSKVFRLEKRLCKNISVSLLSGFVLAMAPWKIGQQTGWSLLVVGAESIVRNAFSAKRH
jgi:hypothetical protein